MNANNIFKKYVDKNDNENSKNINMDTINIQKEEKLYIPPGKRINNQNICKSINFNSNNKLFINKEKQSIKSRPLYRVTSEKLESLEIFPNLNRNSNNENNINDKKETLWVIKKDEELNNYSEEHKKDNYLSTDEHNNSVVDLNDSTKLYVPEGWLLLFELNKGLSISQIEKDRTEKKHKKDMEQFFVDMNYLLKERNAIRKRLYLTCGDYFSPDSIVLRDMPLKLDFLNESDNEIDINNSSTDGEETSSDNEIEYEENEKV